MGKKKIIKPNEEELLKESAKVESEVGKEKKVAPVAVHIQEARVYISSSYNNTIITLTNNQGNVLAWSSAGSIGFRGTKKATPFAASKVAETVSQTIQKLGIQKLDVFVKGVGGGRESAIRSFAAKGLEIMSITDVTPVPHDGTRPPKTRRV